MLPSRLDHLISNVLLVWGRQSPPCDEHTPCLGMQREWVEGAVKTQLHSQALCFLLLCRVGDKLVQTQVSKNQGKQQYILERPSIYFSLGIGGGSFGCSGIHSQNSVLVHPDSKKLIPKKEREKEKKGERKETHSNSCFPSEVLPTPRVETSLFQDKTVAQKTNALCHYYLSAAWEDLSLCICVPVVTSLLTGVFLAGKQQQQDGGGEQIVQVPLRDYHAAGNSQHTRTCMDCMGVRSCQLANVFLCVAVCIPFQIAQTLIKIP